VAPRSDRADLSEGASLARDTLLRRTQRLQSSQEKLNEARAAFLSVLCSFVGLFFSVRVGAAESDPCRSVTFEGNGYTVCEADLRQDVIQLFWKKGDGHPYGFLQALPQRVGEHSGPLLFATNAGMIDPNYKPVGLYIENGRELVHVNTRSGPGNFHLKPNGVFFVAGDSLGVLETGAYLKQHLRPDLATQSGPMLVINGRLHPRFIRYGASRGWYSRHPHRRIRRVG
jgi:uncharacterized protein YigE (DUF2233 family)